jgi:hypothetical protein
MSETNTIELIRKNGQASVSAYDDAVIFHAAIGHDWTNSTRGIVFKSVYKEFGWSIDTVNKKLSILAGYGQLYGRQFKLASGLTYDISLATLGATYLLVYVEINASVNPETIAIKTIFGSGIPSPGNVDIYASASGIATMLLYIFYWTGSSLSLFADYRHIREPGTSESALSIPAEGYINGTLVEDLVENGTGYVKKTRVADVATTAASMGPSGNTNQIDENLKFTNKNCRMLTSHICIFNSSSELASNDSADCIIDSLPTGTIVGFFVNIVGERPTGSSTYANFYADGYIANGITEFYCTSETSNAVTNNNGRITFLQTNPSCWAKITIDLSHKKVTIQALNNNLHSFNITFAILAGGV